MGAGGGGWRAKFEVAFVPHVFGCLVTVNRNLSFWGGGGGPAREGA